MNERTFIKRKMPMTPSPQFTAHRGAGRLAGLDLARFLAFVGMVLVNFSVVMGTGVTEGVAGLLIGALEGRAAASFVVLAGLGLGLASVRSGTSDVFFVTLKRAAFLLVAGLLNTLIFDADILHYYAFYFLFGALCLTLSSTWLVALILLLNIEFVGMMFVFDYDAGWNWQTLTYQDFWTPAGFLRNLFFNGWHPVVPWFGFLLFGLVLSRLDLTVTAVKVRLIVLGLIAVLAAELISFGSIGLLASNDPELAQVLTTAPVPPTPLYFLAGVGSASIVIGCCLLAASWLDRIGVLRFVVPAGRQTLTLYIAHIFIGMGVLELFGLLGNQSSASAVTAGLLFAVTAVVYAAIWSKWFQRGPIEALMRRIAG